jgi:hypothetical protein
MKYARNAVAGFLFTVMFLLPMTTFAGERLVKISGLANDIGGGELTIWIIGTTSVGEAKDFSIHRWSKNSGWKDIDGGGVRIDVAPDDNPWIVNSVGEIFQRINNGWISRPGILAKDIGVGGGGEVWVIGTNPVGTGEDFGVWRWEGYGWAPIPGGGIRIDVDSTGEPWVVNSKGEIWQRLNNDWIKRPGLAKDIGISKLHCEGHGRERSSVWVIGTNPVGDGQDFGIYSWTGNDWRQSGGGGVQITVASCWPYIVNSKGEIYQLRDF